MNIPDHPVIENMEHTGTPDGKKEQYPICPACGEECETVYKDRHGAYITTDICTVAIFVHGAYIGCDVCVETKDAWEVGLCFPESEE